MNLCNINEIKELLRRNGFRFSKSMGQNFLVAGWVPERIAAESGIDSTFGVLEIGPGIGALTVQLCAHAAKVVAVELDRKLLPLLAESLDGFDNVTVISGDILKTDIRQLVTDHLNGLRLAVCANLPYNITTPVLTALIDVGCFETITVMVQREVAQRICASAGKPDYGAFTVYANFYTEPQILFDVPPDCFIPRPGVVSSVLRLKVRKIPPVETDESLFFRVVRGAFAQRRKTLVNSLQSSFSGQISKEEMMDIVRSCGFNEKVRGETLDIPAFARLTAAIARRN
jgi:16S rRNA (adenine1518-N6/adenine1519-N6)-dimethyltransferase